MSTFDDSAATGWCSMNNPLNIVPVVDTRAMQQETKSLLTEVRDMIGRVLDKLT